MRLLGLFTFSAILLATTTSLALNIVQEGQVITIGGPAVPNARLIRTHSLIALDNYRSLNPEDKMQKIRMQKITQDGSYLYKVLTDSFQGVAADDKVAEQTQYDYLLVDNESHFIIDSIGTTWTHDIQIDAKSKPFWTYLI